MKPELTEAQRQVMGAIGETLRELEALRAGAEIDLIPVYFKLGGPKWGTADDLIRVMGELRALGLVGNRGLS